MDPSAANSMHGLEMGISSLAIAKSGFDGPVSQDTKMLGKKVGMQEEDKKGRKKDTTIRSDAAKERKVGSTSYRPPVAVPVTCYEGHLLPKHGKLFKAAGIIFIRASEDGPEVLVGMEMRRGEGMVLNVLGGRREKGEHSRRTASREFVEESGHQVSTHSIQKLLEIDDKSAATGIRAAEVKQIWYGAGKYVLYITHCPSNMLTLDATYNSMPPTDRGADAEMHSLWWIPWAKLSTAAVSKSPISVCPTSTGTGTGTSTGVVHISNFLQGMLLSEVIQQAVAGAGLVNITTTATSTGNIATPGSHNSSPAGITTSNVAVAVPFPPPPPPPATATTTTTTAVATAADDDGGTAATATTTSATGGRDGERAVACIDKKAEAKWIKNKHYAPYNENDTIRRRRRNNNKYSQGDNWRSETKRPTPVMPAGNSASINPQYTPNRRSQPESKVPTNPSANDGQWQAVTRRKDRHHRPI